MSDSLDCSAGETVNADPDVAGIGVILSFFITAWLSLAIAILTFLFVDDALPKDADKPLDSLILRIIGRTRGRKTPWSPNGNILQAICMMFGDQQLITGASILIVCFSTRKTITQYHFSVGASLAFASFATFQSIVIVAGRELRGNRLGKLWRLPWFFLVSIAVTLCNFVFLDENFLLDDQWGAPTQCVWDQLGSYSKGSVAQLTIWTILSVDAMISMLHYLWPDLKFTQFYERTIFLIPRVPLVVISWVNKVFFRRNHGRLRRSFGYALHFPLILVFWVTFALFEIYYSTNFDLFRTYLILLSTTTYVVSLRHQVREYDYLDGNEDAWGFGQILPMLLLALPLFQAIETYFGPDKSKQKEKEKPGSDRKPCQPQSSDGNPTEEADRIDVAAHDADAVPDSGPTDIGTESVLPRIPSNAPGESSTSIPPPNSPPVDDALSEQVAAADLARRGRQSTLIRSLTGFVPAELPTAGNAPLQKTGFWDILELQDLTVKDIEKLMFGHNNLPFKIYLVLVLIGAYASVTYLAIDYSFVL